MTHALTGNRLRVYTKGRNSKLGDNIARKNSYFRLNFFVAKSRFFRGLNDIILRVNGFISIQQVKYI